MLASPLPPGAAREPPYRWVIAFASAVMLAASVGFILSGVSVFLVPLERAFGWSRGEVSLINFAGLAGIAFGGIVMSRASEFIGIRRTIMIGAVTMSLCVLIASRADQLWQFYTIFFLGGFLGGGSLFAPLVANTGIWFNKGVGLAIGIVTGGAGVGTGPGSLPRRCRDQRYGLERHVPMDGHFYAGNASPYGIADPPAGASTS